MGVYNYISVGLFLISNLHILRFTDTEFSEHFTFHAHELIHVKVVAPLSTWIHVWFSFLQKVGVYIYFTYHKFIIIEKGGLDRFEHRVLHLYASAETCIFSGVLPLTQSLLSLNLCRFPCRGHVEYKLTEGSAKI